MQKKNARIVLAGALMATVTVTGASAYEESGSYMESSKGYSTQTQDSSYWEAKKLEMQKRSSEMRVKKVAEMKAKGVDVSTLTGDLLDGTKTEESEFWAAAKSAMNAHEIVSRKQHLEKLKSQGVDVSSITEDVIADGSRFWPAVKKLMEGQQAQMQERKKNVPTNRANENRQGNGELREQNAGTNVLSPKLRKQLETKLRAIPDEKKAAFYEHAKTVIAAQVEKAKEANKPKLVAKLNAILAVIEDVIGPASTEDSDIMNTIFSE